MKYERISGVYKLVTTGSDLCYVGSSKNIHKRVQEHFRRLRKGAHPNIHLQRAYNKYGQDSFGSAIIDTCESGDLVTKEQYWLDWHYSRGLKLYNLTPTAYSQQGRKQTKEEIEKRRAKLTGRKYPPEYGQAISKRMTGTKRSEESIMKQARRMLGIPQPRKMKPVLQYSDGKLINEWTSLKQVVETLPITYSALSMCLTGRNKTCFGFVWKYKH